MSDKELITALKHQIGDLTEEKNDAIKLASEKDNKIRISKSRARVSAGTIGSTR